MTSTLNTLTSNLGSRKKKLRKGRGIAAGQGASCGFGMRGQKSRSGRPTRPGFEGGQMPLYRRVPKLKHFEVINQKKFAIVNLSKLSDFKDNEIDSLYESENRRAMESMMVWKLTEELELEVDQAERFFPKYREHRKEIESLRKKER